MQKYKLINKTTNEEHLCDKVTIDRFDYYVSDEKLNIGDNEIFGNISLKYRWNWGIKKIETEEQLKNELQVIELTKSTRENNPSLIFKKVIATTNPGIDIPKVVDERGSVNWIAKDLHGYDKNMPLPTNDVEVNSFIEGYNKSQETHPNNDEDMIEFNEWCNFPIYRAPGELGFKSRVQAQFPDYNSYIIIDEKGQSLLPKGMFVTTKELLQIWKEQKVKTIYYE